MGFVLRVTSTRTIQTPLLCALLIGISTACARGAVSHAPDTASLLTVGELVVPGAALPGGALIVALPLRNDGDANVQIAEIRLRGEPAVLEIMPQPGNATVLEANATGSWRFRVAVPTNIPSMRVALHATIWISTPRNGLQKVSTDAAVGIIDILATDFAGPAAVVVDSPVEHVAAGGEYPMTVTLVNGTPVDLTVEVDSVTFFFASHNIPVNAVVVLGSGSAQHAATTLRVAPGTLHTLAYNVAFGDIPNGPTITATVEVATAIADGTNPTLYGETSWSAYELSDLWVTTEVDEDDTGGTFSIAAAGGAVDLSLREALLIANAASSSTHIRFDPLAFLESGLPTTIHVDPALGPLPDITVAGSWLDGTAAGVEIVGDVAEASPLLWVTADNVHISGLSLRHGLPACLRSTDADGLLIHDVEFLGCAGSSVKIEDGANHQLLNNVVRPNDTGSAIWLGSATRSVLIAGNDITGIRDSGLLAQGTGHEIRNNKFSVCRTTAISLAGAHSVLISENSMIQCGHSFPTQDSAVRVAGTSKDVRIERNTFEANNPFAVGVESEATNVSLTRNIFKAHPTAALFRFTTGANGSLARPTITEMTATTVSGTHSSDNALIEVYHQEANGAATWLGDATVLGGVWQLTGLAAPLPKFIATATTAQGTSDFSLPGFTPTAALIVTVIDDELDGGTAMFTVTAAGGPADLSLREAIHIANNREGPDTITFSPGLFPTGAATLIDVRAVPEGLGPLPSITDAFLTIDGTGAGVTIDGGSATFTNEAPLLIVAQDTTLRALTIQNFPGAPSLIHAPRGSTRLSVEDVTVSCGAMAGKGFDINGTEHVRLTRVQVAHCRIGVQLGNDVTDTQIVDSELRDMGYACVNLNTARRVSVYDSTLFRCGTFGISIGISGPTEIVGNTVWGTPVAIKYTSSWSSFPSTTVIAHNTLVENDRGVLLANTAGHAEIDNNIIAHNVASGIGQSNGNWNASHNLFFDNSGDGTSGTNAIEGVLPINLSPSVVLADPMLTDRLAKNFTATAAIFDAGQDVGYDRNGVSVLGNFDGAAPDIGALELQ